MENSQIRTFVLVAIGLLSIGVIASLLVFWGGFAALPNVGVIPTVAVTPAASEGVSTAARIMQRDKLIVGVRANAKPFGDIDQDGKLVGFDVDLGREFARRWLGSEDKVTLVTVGTSDRIPRLVAGEVDLLIAALPQRRERDALIDFSQTYFQSGETLLVRDNSIINTLVDLHGRHVAVLQGSTIAETLRNAAGKQEISLNLQPYADPAAALLALQNEQVDALAGDNVLLTQFAGKTPGLRLLAARFTQESYAVGLRQGDSALRELVNFTLQDMKKDGVYDQLYQRWFPTDQPYAIEHSSEKSAVTLAELSAQPTPVTTSRVETILQRGRLIVGVHQNFAPFSYLNNSGVRSGFDIDLAYNLALRWLGAANAVELVADDPTKLVDRLAAGELDIVVAALGEQRSWADKVDFSQSYLGQPLVTLPLTIGLPQNDSAIRELVNTTLQEMQTDGTYPKILTAWFGETALQYQLEVVPGDASYLLLPFQQQAAPPRVTAATLSTIDRIRQRNNALIAGVAIDAPPFGFLNSDGQVTGFDVELIHALAQEWGVEVQFVPVTAVNRIEKLVAGEVDLAAAAMPRRKDQAEQIDFSQTYFLQQLILVTLPDTAVQSIRDLDTRAVGIVDQAAGDQLQAFATVNQIGIENRLYPSTDVAVAALEIGEVAAILVSNVALGQGANRDLPFIQLTNPFVRIPYALGLPADDSYFNNLVNITLQTLKQRGLYDQLYHKWFGASASPYALEVYPGFWPYTFAQSPITLDKPVLSKVDQILAERKFTAGVFFDLKPFGFLDSHNQPAGFDVDIIREFARRWLGDTTAVELLPVTSANRFSMLAAGEVDLLAAAMPHQREWDELIDFSQSYFAGGQGFLVRGDAGVSTLVDLNHKVIAAIEGSAAIGNIQSLAASQAITIEILRFQEYPQALAALKAGQVAALTADQSALQQFAQDNPELVVLNEHMADEPYGLGIPNFDGRFQDLVNFTLQEMKLDGSYDHIYQKWFGGAPPFAVETWPERSYFDLDLIPMVHIPAGEFVRGNPEGFPDERFVQTIFLDEFYIDQYEVTNRQYSECVQAGRCTPPQSPRSVNFTSYYGDAAFGNYPVLWVTWDDAVTYCQFHGKRLPTEAEWEKAARGPQGFIFPWGNDEPTTQANYNYAASDVTPVGAYPVDLSGYAVYDMAGNVREWVADWYQWDYYLAPEVRNPTGPATGVTKVLRGGSWNDVATYLRSTVRKNFLRESVDSNLGFRCASSTFPPP